MSKTRSPLPPGATRVIANLGADLKNARRRVLFGYGMIQRLEHLMDPPWDRVGLAQEEERMPRRIRSRPASGSG